MIGHQVEGVFVCPLPHPMVIEVVGQDAARVVNNLTTNDMLKLPEGGHAETFVTDVRGWTVAHGLAVKLAERMLLIGQHPSPAAVCQHIDRYIIREDARVVDLSAGQRLLVSERTLSLPDSILHFQAPILGSESILWCGDHAELEQLATHAQAPQWASEFQWRRIASFWPIVGQDILEKCIPQEVDRDRAAISFTKGCYLGQETIARLDARGQLQKKLCLLQLDGPAVPPGTPLLHEAKPVGQITSAASAERLDQPGQLATRALAYLRRGFFEPGTQLECLGSMASVVSPPTLSVT